MKILVPVKRVADPDNANKMKVSADGSKVTSEGLEWKLNPFDGHLFVFFGRRLDRVKILVWDRNGFVLYYKRLSQGRFRMPKIPANVERVELDATTLAMLLDGIDVKHVRRPTAWSPPAALAQAR